MMMILLKVYFKFLFNLLNLDHNHPIVWNSPIETNDSEYVDNGKNVNEDTFEDQHELNQSIQIDNIGMFDI